MTISQYIAIGQILTAGRKEKSVGTKERKVREKAARRDAILEAAKSVFFERGYHTATMDRIAEEVELSKGSLYLHFPSKEELYISLLVEGLAELCKRFDQAVQGSRGWEEKLLRIRAPNAWISSPRRSRRGWMPARLNNRIRQHRLLFFGALLTVFSFYMKTKITANCSLSLWIKLFIPVWRCFYTV